MVIPGRSWWWFGLPSKVSGLYDQDEQGYAHSQETGGDLQQLLAHSLGVEARTTETCENELDMQVFFSCAFNKSSAVL